MAVIATPTTINLVDRVIPYNTTSTATSLLLMEQTCFPTISAATSTTTLPSHEVRETWSRQGKCIGCGAQLYELKKSGWRRNRIAMVPLSIEGKVNCGQCVSCSQQLLQASFARPPPPPQLSQLQTPPPARKRLSLIEDDDGDEPSSTEATVSFVDDGLTDDSGRDSLFDGSHQQEQRQPCQQNEFAITSSTRSQEPSVYYEGDMNAYGQPHGGGDMIFANGDRYYGQFLNGKLHGKGTMLFVNGSTYVGSWECGYMHGSGTFHFQNGDVYEGEYQNSKRCGHGRMEFINGDLYVGSWQGGQMHGLGKYLYHNHHKFEGTFAMGARHGKGKYQYPDGEIIIHKYVRDQRMGEGVQFSADRKQVWRTVGGKRKGRITLRQAEVIMLRCEEEEEY